MKEKLTNNIGLKLLSLLLAFLLWVTVINSQDPLEKKEFTNVPVTILNESSLTEKDKIPEIVEGETITVEVEARRSICDKLTVRDIVAVADFEKLSVTNAVTIEVSVKGYTSREVEIVRGQNEVMKLSLEDSISKEFPVKIATMGEPATGYVTGDMVASPNIITLTGSSTQIGKIKEVVLVVDISDLSNERQVSDVPVVYDMEGEIVDSGKVSLSSENVKVTVPVLKTKSVTIDVKTVGEVAAGYEISSISYLPQSVIVAGTATDLVLLGNKLTAYVDVTDATGNVESNMDITALWDADYKSLRLVGDEETRLSVTVTVREQEEKIMEITPGSVEIGGVAMGLEARIRELSQNQVCLKGNQTKLKETTLAKLAPRVDLTGYTPGTYTVAVSFENLSGLLLRDIIFAQVIVTEAVEPTPIPTPTPTAEPTAPPVVTE